MSIYILNFILIIVWEMLLLRINPTDKKKKIFCSIVAIQWILISGLRHIELSRDVSINYINHFENTKTYSWSFIFDQIKEYLFNGLSVKDPGYTLLMKIFQIFSGEFQMFLFCIAVFFTTAMAIWIYKYSAMPALSFIIYSSLFYSFFALTGLRQTIATAIIVFIGDKYIKERKIGRYILLAFIAFLIHKSSIVYTLYFLIAGINISAPYVATMSLSISVIALLGKQVYAPVAYALGFGEEAIEYEGDGASTYALVLLMVCLAAFVLYPWISKRREDSKYLYNLMFLTVGSTLLIFHHQGFMRIQQYFSLVIMIMIPEMILSIQKKYQFVFFGGAVVILFVYLLMNSPHYKFFWQ